MAYQMSGGGVRPVQTRPAAPPTAGVNRDTPQPSDTPVSRIPPHIVDWAKKAGRDPKEMWKRMQARRRPPLPEQYK